jgi:hypothetical protein
MIHRFTIGIALAVVAGSLLVGCTAFPKSAEPPPPFNPDEVGSVKVLFPETTGNSLAIGRDLFVAKCGKCHDHANLMLIEDRRWPEIMKRMGKKAKLETGQADLVLEYILAVRAARKVQTASR